MSTPLLLTKLYVPSPQPGLVHRSRLINQIDEGLSRKLTLISAPPGFGKTTLLSEWIPTSRRRVTWLSLEDADNDPPRFWTYFMAALQILQDDLVKDAQALLLAEGQQTHLESFMIILINDLARFPDKFALVLDDYQHINNQEIHEGIIFLLDHLPPKMHLMITCRADPPLPLARLRAKGQVNEVRADDLRFTSEEAVLFLNQTMGLNLSEDLIAALETRTEGWIAGLQLAAISMRRRADNTGFIESFTGSHRYILDYLVDEVLNCQPEEMQIFLRETSILDRFTGALCSSLTGKDNGQSMLDELVQAELFIIPLDNEGRWYRYHHLFSDLLRGRLQELEPERVRELHRRASEWFDSEGLLPEAVNHALIASEFERAAQLIEKVAEEQRQRGEVATLTGWMNVIPRSIRRTRPALCLLYARALVDTAQNNEVEILIEDAVAGLAKDQIFDDRTIASLQGQIAALRAYLAMIRYQFEETLEHSRRAKELLGEHEARWRSFVALNLAGTYRFTSDWGAANQTYLEASALSQVAGDKVNTLIALSMRGEVLHAQGHLRQSAQQFEEVLQLAQELDIPHAPALGYALVGLGRTLYEWNDLEKAYTYAQDGIEWGKKGEFLDILLRGYLLEAHIRQSQGDLDAALEALEKAELSARQMGMAAINDWVNALRVQVWLAAGKTEAAVSWAASFSVDLDDRIFPSVAIVLARVRLAQKQPDKALTYLVHALHSAYEVGRLGNAVQILCVTALAYQAKGDIKNGNSALSQALTLGEPEGYIRVFLDEGEPMRLLIADFRLRIEKQKRDEDAKLIGYTDKLLAAFTPPIVWQSTIKNLKSEIVEPLSERELEVLRLMAAGLSNRDIAEKDVVSINTIKTQVKSIYGKLGVHQREDAVAAARQLRLL